MYHLNIPLIIVFIAFTVISGLITFFCSTVIRKNLEKLRKSNLSIRDKARTRFSVTMMIIPTVGFGFEFIYFLYKTFQSLLRLI